jgi:cellulose synthase/poly-beta-1,6-N-acetylglucosamine synthase-like glycosyltransferase/peptidoglycan/xylan/chitin deacetylase (PgdA/CDA1 family)
MASKPVFFDATGRRAAILAYVFWTLAVLGGVTGIGFAANLIITPPARDMSPPERAVAMRVEARAQKPALVASAERLAAVARRRRLEFARRHPAQLMPDRVLPSILKPQKDRPLAVGFYVNWGRSQPPSFASLKRNLPHLDWVVPTWVTLDGPNLSFKPSLDRASLEYMRGARPGVAILPLLQNISGGKWYGPELAKLLSDRNRRATLIGEIGAFLAANRLQGVVVDFESVPAGAYGNLKLFLTELSASFAGHGWIVAMTAPFDDDSWPYAAFASVIDYTMLMAYDEHYATGEAGPIAGQEWYESWLDKRMAVLPAAATIVLFGNYGLDWVRGQSEATPLQFDEAMVAARDAGAPIVFDHASNNPHFLYRDTDGVHDVWFLDAVTAFNQIHAADPYRPAGYGLWHLGREDPSVTALLQRPYNLPAPQSLKHIEPGENVYPAGQGEIFWVESDPVSGARDLSYDVGTGDIVDEHYTALPTNYVIRLMGASAKKLAITFDDGPDPEWTPQLLEILKQKHVPATFFMIGANMEAHPGLVQRVLADGHEIGNHTYTHPNLADTPLAAVRVELNATQRLFEALTGRSLRLFRPPYLADTAPSDAAEIEPIQLAQELGYTSISTNIETLDWKGLTPSQMMKRTLDLVNSPNPDLRGNIILMHDSGGDRSNAVAFLPLLIDTMRARGYQFVPVSDLICQVASRGAQTCWTRDDVMPALPVTISLFADRVVFLTLSAIGRGLYYCFLGAIVLGVARLLLLCGLAFWHRLFRHELPPAAGVPALVSVLIPAFNEEKVIASTIEGILASDHAELEVIVIDDGSHDRTAAVVASHFRQDPRVSVLSLPNGGKASALNAGLASARGEVVVALDADTHFNPDTISRLVRWFVDPEVGAVAGNAKVGNRVNIITRWQALEYIVAQNLERRALSALGVLTVVPGAVGAWRRSVLRELGGFPTDTLAEDQDLTIAIQTRGYRVRFDSEAIAWTEAPATVKGLARQRFRWAFGTLQCLWKYRRITFNPRQGELGMVALPQVWLFQILLTALAPVADLLLVWQLISEYLAHLQHPNDYTFANLEIVLGYYAAFVLVDLLAGTIGFVMEKREDWKLLLWLPLQRFGYRQIMYYVVLRSIATALRGPFVGWGKLERTGMRPRRA